jgi:hypothetical protein
MNIFVNILYNPNSKLVIYYLSDSYKIIDIVAIINCTLYRLYNSFTI